MTACIMHGLEEPRMEWPSGICQAHLQLPHAVLCTPATPQRATAGPAAASRSCWSPEDLPGQQDWQCQPGLRALLRPAAHQAQPQAQLLACVETQTSVSLHAYHTAVFTAAELVVRVQWSKQGHLDRRSFLRASNSIVRSPEPAVNRLPLSALDNSESIRAALRPQPTPTSADVCSGADRCER